MGRPLVDFSNTLEPFVSVCSPFTLSFTCWWQSPRQRVVAAYLETVHTQPRGEDAGSGAIWRSVSNSRTLKNMAPLRQRIQSLTFATTLSCTFFFVNLFLMCRLMISLTDNWNWWQELNVIAFQLCDEIHHLPSNGDLLNAPPPSDCTDLSSPLSLNIKH